MNIQDKQEWQFVDEKLNALFPYYTKSFLDVLSTWELEDKHVFEFGGGASSLWFLLKGCYVDCVDSSEDWAIKIRKHAQERNVGVRLRVKHFDNKEECIERLKAADPYDIIVVDCDPVEWRDDFILSSMFAIKNEGLIIVDNFDQPSVWMSSKKTRDKLWGYPCEIYKCDGHPDWQTAVFKIYK